MRNSDHRVCNRSGVERRKVVLGAAGLLAAAAGGVPAFRALAERRGLTTRTRAGIALGTTISFTLAGTELRVLEAALGNAFRAVRQVEAAASLFRPDSGLSRLNRDGRLADPDPLLVMLLRFGLDLARATDGAFDPTVQPLWPLWAKAAAKGTRPSDAALAEAVGRVGWQDVTINEEAIGFERPGMGVTLNALVQGFAADQAMAAIAAHGIADAFIDTGEFGARGSHPDGTPWRLGIADPRAPSALAEVVVPFTGFAATSGDYAMSFSPDSSDHHIFDPRTGRSPHGLSSATVTAPTGLLADGLSTAVFVLGEAGGRRLVAQYPDCTMRIIAKA
ncbi:FAD:protein FMN transferase [Methylobacterium iners]|uniref:FAD:protein FMN transferase n=1 Tax=Methylobacterium iners TaxID=418707 RepID=A0ABQ4RSJ3_9HYPH|nr:FAD:protein FMN transferase [Methylobacterium iners]GJD93325.1 hypothetical protein OCOJLMKI_0517 [Methylobacterium iners]